MPKSGWTVSESEELDSGHRCVVTCGGREIIVLHKHAGWQAWNGQARCEVLGAVKAAVLDYERNPE